MEKQKRLDTHLGLREMKGGRELGPLGDAEVLPFRELLLERQQLLRGERRPRLPVRLVFPQVALDLGRFSVLCNRNSTGWFTLEVYTRPLFRRRVPFSPLTPSARPTRRVPPEGSGEPT